MQYNVYNVCYERDEDGWWVASIRAVPGCHTQGRTISQARRRIREALSLFVDNSNSAVLVDKVRLPAGIKHLLNKVETSRKRAELEKNTLGMLTLDAAKALTQELGVSVRDAGELLGLSHQRIQQLVNSKARNRE